VKVVYAASFELFRRQDEAYRQRVLSEGERIDSTVITTAGRATMVDWLFNKLAEEYALSSDWDDRWRTGGDLAEVIEEAHLSPEWVLKGIQRFVADRPQRLERLRRELQAVAD
jgi:transketolase